MSVSLQQTTIPVADLTAEIDLIGLLRQENEQMAEFRHCWTLCGAEASFVVGVAGDRGVLAWYGPDAVDGMEVTADGGNADPVDYRLGGLYPQPFPAGSEIPIDQVYAAVQEFLATRTKPRSVRWQPEREAWARSTQA